MLHEQHIVDPADGRSLCSLDEALFGHTNILMRQFPNRTGVSHPVHSPGGGILVDEFRRLSNQISAWSQFQ
jgi:hypothetical protein